MSDITLSSGALTVTVNAVLFGDLLLALDRPNDARRMIGEWSSEDCRKILGRLRKLRQINDSSYFEDLTTLVWQAATDDKKVIFK